MAIHPYLSDAEVQIRLAKAKQTIDYRYRVRQELRRGDLSLVELIEASKTNPLLRTFPVAKAIRCLPAMGEVKTSRVLFRAKIRPEQYLSGLTDNQVDVLLLSMQLYAPSVAVAA